ncbi:MAG: hypothetical protein U0746_04285 [Gemmataceae bacterium]
MSRISRIAPWIAVYTLFVIGAFGRDDRNGLTKHPPEVESVGDLNDTNNTKAIIYHTTQVSYWEKALRQWRVSELYRKLSVDDLLIECLGDDSAVTTADYKWRVGEHSLNTISGRTAAVIDAVYGIHITPMKVSPSKAELVASQREIRAVLEAYRQGVFAMIDEFAVGRPAEYLKKKYLDRLTPRKSKQAARQAEDMERLLGEWLVVGKQLKELEAVAGVADHIRVDQAGRRFAEYRFDEGSTGVAFKFVLDDGRIRSVVKSGIY